MLVADCYLRITLQRNVGEGRQCIRDGLASLNCSEEAKCSRPAQNPRQKYALYQFKTGSGYCAGIDAAPTVHAADADDNLAEIVVTANRREQN